MKYRICILRRAQADARDILKWIAERSPSGAETWFAAIEQAVEKLKTDAGSYARAAGADEIGFPIHELLFQTPHGKPYRLIYLVVGDEVRLLRVRGHGQRPLELDDLGG